MHNKGIRILSKESEDEEDDGRVEKKLRRTSGGGIPLQKRRKMPPRQINAMDKGKGILYEDSDSDDSSYRASDADEATSDEEFGSRIKDLGTANSEARDVKTPIKRRNIDYLGRELFETGLLPRPTSKYFVTTVNPKRKNELHMPKDLHENENLCLPDKITLVGPNGKEFQSSLKRWPDRSFYHNGWKELCTSNGVTEHDYCICEFEEGRRPAHLFVNILQKDEDDDDDEEGDDEEDVEDEDEDDDDQPPAKKKK